MTTPIRRQYLHFKARHPDAILFFRLGDFYETFDDDAALVARELGIMLTSKPMGAGLRVPLAGVPVKNVDHHLARLIERGHRVAICEQLEDARASRKLVRRGVVRVISPGTALEPTLLEAGQPSACAALHMRSDRRRISVGLASADITTGRFQVCQFEQSALDPTLDRLWERVADQIQRTGVRELLLSDQTKLVSADDPTRIPDLGIEPSLRPARDFRPDRAEDALRRQYSAPPAAFGLDERPAALSAAGALLEYLHHALPRLDDESESEYTSLRHLESPQLIEPEGRLQWDAATERALALVEAGPGAAPPGSPRTLFDVLDRCSTVLGRRWLRAALLSPLLDQARIERRLDRIQALVRRQSLRRLLISELNDTPDLERLLSRAAAGLVSPGELATLARGLVGAEALGAHVERALDQVEADSAEHSLASLVEPLSRVPDAARQLAETLVEHPPADYGQGVIRAGVDPAVDRAAARADAATQQLAELESALRQESGIDNLKVGYHRTFGHYIELRRGQAALAPEAWERRQSLRDRERYSEPRLRQIAEELAAAQLALTEAERTYVDQLRIALIGDAPQILRTASAAARLDAACALADLAADQAWTRPELESSAALEIVAGRHPVVEASFAQGAFVPNDLALSDDGVHAPQLLLVTGPNMAGKSTYLRQTALIVILAQIGSYVPAESARIGLVDQIFARVGAHDDLAAGRSTFLVEMLETARLLHGATARSLILLDEIGRGTSTWDGLAIAQAVAEALASEASRPERGPRTLFATHFHELTALAGALPRVANAAVQVEEDEQGGIRFPYRVRAGAADRSYGVQVAAQAGLPASVVARAGELLHELESADRASAPKQPTRAQSTATEAMRNRQLTLIPRPAHPILHDLADLDIDGITPLEAISALYALRDQAQRELRSIRSDAAAGGGS